MYIILNNIFKKPWVGLLKKNCEIETFFNLTRLFDMKFMQCYKTNIYYFFKTIHDYVIRAENSCTL